MRTHTTTRNSRRVLALVASAALCGVLATSTPAVASAPSTAGTTAGNTVLTPTLTSLSAAEQPNPLRGEYRWIGQSSPLGLDDPDSYDRDRVYWGRLEAKRDSYDFTWIENGLADAASRQGKFGFRVMAYCPGCWMESRSDYPSVVPSWLPVDGQKVPHWNSEVFLSEWEELWADLGQRYGDDPRLGYVDVGGFGKYGEWMPAGDTLTEASAKRIISAVATAFPSTHVLLSAVTVYPVTGIENGRAPYILQWALSTYPNLGLRSDCLGNPLMQRPEATGAGDFSTVWKTRPFFTEWCTNGEPTLGLQQVKDNHVSTISSGNMRLAPADMTSAQLSDYRTLIKLSGYRYAVSRAELSPVAPGQGFRVDLTVRNDGVAPTYDPWTVRLVLRDGSGTRVAALPLDVDLRTALPGTRTFTRYLTAPNIAEGSYQASVEVVDPAAYSAPMRLMNSPRAADGSYPLGTVGVGQEVQQPGSAPSWPVDVTGDGEPDVLAVEAKSGALRVYPTTGTGRWETPIRQGSEWNGYKKLLTAGTWDGDAVNDVLVQDSAGALYLRRGNGDGTFAAPRKVGSGWQVHNLVFPVGDFDGNGYANLMARRWDGTLYLYSGDGNGGFGKTRKIGSGWQIFSAVFSPGDFDGDGNPDVIARAKSGVLYLYPGNGSGGWKPRRTIGSGWNVFTALTSVGDWDGDGAADVLARTTSGDLLLYRGNGRGYWNLPRRKVGSGWQIFSTIVR
jgi:hypothetical protein